MFLIKDSSLWHKLISYTASQSSFDLYFGVIIGKWIQQVFYLKNFMSNCQNTSWLYKRNQPQLFYFPVFWCSQGKKKALSTKTPLILARLKIVQLKNDGGNTIMVFKAIWLNLFTIGRRLFCSSNCGSTLCMDFKSFHKLEILFSCDWKSVNTATYNNLPIWESSS